MRKIFLSLLFLIGLFLPGSLTAQNINISQNIAVTAQVESSISVSMDKKTVSAETNLQGGYWVIKDHNTIFVVAKI
jgi:hypothetical protein